MIVDDRCHKDSRRRGIHVACCIHGEEVDAVAFEHISGSVDNQHSPAGCQDDIRVKRDASSRIEVAVVVDTSKVVVMLLSELIITERSCCRSVGIFSRLAEQCLRSKFVSGDQ